MSPRNRSVRSASVDRWTVPVACVVIGVVYLVIGIAHGRTALGAVELLIMVAFGAALVVSRRRGSETAALVAGDTADERRVQIQVRSSAATGRVLVLVVVAGLFWSLAADNGDAGVFGALAVIGGVTTFASTFWYSRRG